MDSDIARTKIPTFASGCRWLMLTLEIIACLALPTLFSFLLPRRALWDESLFRLHGARRYDVETLRWGGTFLLGLFVLLLVTRIGIGRWKRVHFGLATSFASLGECASILLVRLCLGSVGILVLPGIVDAAWKSYDIQSDIDVLVLLFWISPVVAGFGEENFFRCYLQGMWMGADRAWGALASAVCFALVHRSQGLVAVVGLHLPTSLLISGVYARHRDLPSQIVFHVLCDMIVFAELWAIHQKKIDGYATACASNC